MITGVAILLNGVCHSMPRPNRHHHIIHALARGGMYTPIKGEQGFMDSEEGFVDREMAYRLAYMSGQLPKMTSRYHAKLFSEDIW